MTVLGVLITIPTFPPPDYVQYPGCVLGMIGPSLNGPHTIVDGSHRCSVADFCLFVLDLTEDNQDALRCKISSSMFGFSG